MGFPLLLLVLLFLNANVKCLVSVSSELSLCYLWLPPSPGSKWAQVEWRDPLRACEAWKAAVRLIANRAERAGQSLVSLTSSQEALLPTSKEGGQMSVQEAQRQAGTRLPLGIRPWTSFCHQSAVQWIRPSEVTGFE